MGLLNKLFRRKNTDEIIDLDRIPEVTIDDVTQIEMPMGSFRRGNTAEDRVRVTMTMKKSTFEWYRRLCCEINTNGSETIRAALFFSERPFRKNPRLVKDFDE